MGTGITTKLRTNVRDRRLDRILTLLAVELAIIIAIFSIDYLFFDHKLFNELFFPTDTQVPKWGELAQTMLIAFGIPAALLLWFWRDRNVRDQIENETRQINIAEFQDMQLRLAGAVSDGADAHARTTLEMAALYQLSDFLHGRKGKGFQRPAFELLRAKLDAVSQRDGAVAIKRRLMRYQSRVQRTMHKPIKRQKAKSLTHKFRQKAKRWYMSQFDSGSYLGYRNFISDECSYIISEVLPYSLLRMHGMAFHGKEIAINNIRELKNFCGAFSGISLDGYQISGCELEYCNVARISFVGTKVSGCNFTGAVFTQCDFSKCECEGGNWFGSIFFNCTFNGSSFRQADFSLVTLLNHDLQDVDFERSSLNGAELNGSNLNGANLAGCDLRNATLLGVDPRLLRSCVDAHCNRQTLFHLPVEGSTYSWNDEYQESMRQLWSQCGAKFED